MSTDPSLTAEFPRRSFFGVCALAGVPLAVVPRLASARAPSSAPSLPAEQHWRDPEPAKSAVLDGFRTITERMRRGDIPERWSTPFDPPAIPIPLRAGESQLVRTASPDAARTATLSTILATCLDAADRPRPVVVVTHEPPSELLEHLMAIRAGLAALDQPYSPEAMVALTDAIEVADVLAVAPLFFDERLPPLGDSERGGGWREAVEGVPLIVLDRVALGGSENLDASRKIVQGIADRYAASVRAIVG